MLDISEANKIDIKEAERDTFKLCHLESIHNDMYILLQIIMDIFEMEKKKNKQKD